MERDAVTAVLIAAKRESGGGKGVVDELVPLVYDQLRLMARRQLAREGDRLTLDTTGLVHEAYLKLVDQTRAPVKSRGYFFGAAARAMRQVLVDVARRRRRLKRGGGERPLPLDETRLAVDLFAVRVLDLDEALHRLESEFPRQARVVECRFFGGLSVEETAEALEVSARTVKGDWALARSWLHQALTGVR